MRVKCPNCGRERIIQAGKKKNCRKCGLQLTATGELAQPKKGAAIIATADQTIAKLTVADLESQRPDLVAEIRGEIPADKPSASDPEPAELENAIAKGPVGKYGRLSKAKLIAELKKRDYEIDKVIKKAKNADLIQYLLDDEHDLQN